jgi:hypothetical protein
LKMYTISLVLALIAAATFLSAFSLAPLLQPAPVEAQQFPFEEPPAAAPEEGQRGVEQSVERQQSTERQQQSSQGGGGAAEPEEEGVEPDFGATFEPCLEGDISECVNQAVNQAAAAGG